MSDKILSDGTYVAQLSISVGGIHRTGYNISDQDVGDGKEVVNQNKTTIENRDQLKLANELKNRATGIFTKYRATAAGWYILTASDTLPKCRAELNELQQEIDVHNATFPAHTVRVTFQTNVIALETSAVLGFFATVEATLIGIEKAIRAGDFSDAKSLQVEAKNFSKLLPVLIGTMVDDGLDQAREAVNDCCAELRHEEKRAAKLSRAYTADPMSKGRAANLAKLEAAIGWVSTHEIVEADSGATQQQANA